MDRTGVAGEEDLVAVGDRARFQGFKEAKRLALQSRRINRDPESLKPGSSLSSLLAAAGVLIVMGRFSSITSSVPAGSVAERACRASG